jgi:hypothetical protein
MSADDCQLHRTVFPRAYTCSLVVSNIAEDRDVVQSLFGWHRGLIKQRGYYVVDNNRRSASDNVKVISPERKTTTKPSGG